VNLLLDTHILLWWLAQPDSLSKQAHQAISNGSNIIYVSAAVIWEMVIKKSVGKLEIPDNIEKMLQLNNFNLLPISVAHALAADKLPSYHRDPFDRMLIAQAIQEGLTLVNRDAYIQKYSCSQIIG
jgi:PIN domain nuclease of toxin-antitoxin system